MKRSIVFALVGVTLLTGAVALAAGAATRSAADCNPAHQYCNPGLLPAGVYTTRYFLPGMKVTVPAGGWQSSQDSAIEFKLYPPNYAPTDSSPAIRFWIDPHVS